MGKRGRKPGSKLCKKCRHVISSCTCGGVVDEHNIEEVRENHTEERLGGGEDELFSDDISDRQGVPEGFVLHDDTVNKESTGTDELPKFIDNEIRGTEIPVPGEKKEQTQNTVIIGDKFFEFGIMNVDKMLSKILDEDVGNDEMRKELAKVLSSCFELEVTNKKKISVSGEQAGLMVLAMYYAPLLQSKKLKNLFLRKKVPQKVEEDGKTNVQ